MRNFRNGITPIVRIKNREYMYIKNTIYGYSPELEGLGFEHHEEAPTYRKYSRPVEKSEIESAYRVECNYGIYKGVPVRVADFPFTCPEIVYLKKDSQWIPWHAYGALLKEGEWV